MTTFVLPMLAVLVAGLAMAWINRHFNKRHERMREVHERERAEWEAMDGLARDFYLSSFRVGGVTAAFRGLAEAMAGKPANELAALFDVSGPLQVDPAYQRPVRQELAQRIADQWGDPDTSDWDRGSA